MNRKIPHIALILTFMLRIMVPITNALYFFGELTLGRDGLWKTLYIVSLLLEVAAIVMLALGLHGPVFRRVGAYISLGLPGLHYAATLIPFIILPTARAFIGPVYMTVLTVAYAATAALAFLLLRTPDGMEPSEREAITAVPADRPHEITDPNL